MSEDILLHYKNAKVYNNTPSNAIGATDSALRITPSHNNTNTLFIQKTIAYPKINNLTNLNIDNPRTTGSNELTWQILGNDKPTESSPDYFELLGHRVEVGGVQSSYIDGLSITYGDRSWRKFKLRASTDVGSSVNVQQNDTLTLTSGGVSYKIYLPAFSLAPDENIELFFAGADIPTLSLTSIGDQNTYLDDALNNIMAYYISDGTTENPFRTIQEADDDGTYAQLCIQDNSIYDEDLTIANTTYLMAEDGYIPTVKREIGPRVTRQATQIYYNNNALFWNENGTDPTAGGDGTWANPFRTPAAAIAFRTTGGGDIVYGGLGAANGTTEVDSDLVINGFKFEADSYYTPKIRFITNNKFDIYNGGSVIGFEIDGNNVADDVCYINAEGNVYDCEIYSAFVTAIYIDGTDDATSNINRCILRDNDDECIGVVVTDTKTSTIYINDCLIYDNGNGFYAEGDTNANCGLYMYESQVYDNANDGIRFLTFYNAGLTVKNNVFDSMGNAAIWIEGVGNLAITIIHNNQITNNVIGVDNEDAVAIQVNNNNFYGNTSDTVGSVTQVNCIAVNPLYIGTADHYYGLSYLSPCLGVGLNDKDIGLNKGIIYLSTNLTLNGLIIDANNHYANCIRAIETAKTNTVKWCTLKNAIVGAINTGDTAGTYDFENNKIYGCGNGVKLYADDTIFKYNLIYDCDKLGLIPNASGLNVQFNVHYNADHNVYFGTEVTNITWKNNIYYAGVTYNIFSLVNLTSTYNCCLTLISSNVDFTSETNVTADPLFVDPYSTEEDKDLHIRTIEAGYTFDSPCKNAADASDIGAYQFNPRGLGSDSWRKLSLVYGPHFANIETVLKGYASFETAEGNIRAYQKDDRRVIPFVWSDDSYSTRIQRETLRYISRMVRGTENSLTLNDEIIRLHFKPTEFIDSGTSATLSGTTLTDSNKSWVYDEWRGFYVGIKFDSGSGNGNISSDVLTVSGAGWTADEWIGYYFYYGGYYYLITDNDTTTLTLADPDNTLANATSINWSIEKYFRILAMTSTAMTLYDPNDELDGMDGTYDYYIDFLDVRVQSSAFGYSQFGFDFDNEVSKTGYSITFEECE